MTRHFTRKKVKWLRTASLFIKLDRLNKTHFLCLSKWQRKNKKEKRIFSNNEDFVKQNNSFTADQSLTDITILENKLSIGTNSFINTQAIGTIILKVSCTKEATVLNLWRPLSSDSLRGVMTMWGSFNGLGPKVAFHHLLPHCTGQKSGMWPPLTTREAGEYDPGVRRTKILQILINANENLPHHLSQIGLVKKRGT